MACYFPLHRFIIGADRETGKERSVVTSGKTDFIKVGRSMLTSFQEIPCGKCVGCRLDYARTWATRCVLEAKSYEKNCMLTLTYDDEHLPKSIGADVKTGEVRECSTLQPDDVTKFLKRFRKKHKFRYFYCGEYGDETQRAHYHIIIFGYEPEDKKEWKKTKEGHMLYTSTEMDVLWSKGFVTVSEFNFDTACYVARYVMKKRKGKGSKDEYTIRGQMPEFVRMSRKPGIAWQYFDDNSNKIYETQNIFVKTSSNLLKCKPPRYYDNLYDVKYPGELERFKKARKELSEAREKMILSMTGLTRDEYLKQQNDIVEHEISRRTRNCDL